MGSGTTGVTCKNLSRNFIGIELSSEYFEIAKKRIETPKENGSERRRRVMRVKDIVNLKGCYSAKDVGDLELPIIKGNDFLLAISSYHSGNVEEAGEIYQALLREFIILFKPPKEV